MAMITKRGTLPRTPHTEFYAKVGVFSLEEIHGSYGFNGAYSRKVHLRSYPTEQSKPPKKSNLSLIPLPAGENVLQPYHILTKDMPYEGDVISGRKVLLFGLNTIISVSKPSESMQEKIFFRNGEKHELYFVHEGEGVLKTEYGNLKVRKNHYLIIPKGTTYSIELSSKDAFFLIIESRFPIIFPPHYMNKEGQATLMAPIVETEIEVPELPEPIDQKGDFEINVKHNGGNLSTLTLSHHPFDVVGWEGSLYPFAFDINNHHCLVREIHTAPPTRQTFQSGDGNTYGFSICSFITQIEGWHPKDIAAPYAHYNVDSDEVMFFASEKYGAREGVITEASITFHPGSLPHSPHGDSAKRSTKMRGKLNEQLAVMLDTFFESLTMTEIGYKYRDKEYALSWHKAASAVKS